MGEVLSAGVVALGMSEAALFRVGVEMLSVKLDAITLFGNLLADASYIPSARLIRAAVAIFGSDSLDRSAQELQRRSRAVALKIAAINAIAKWRFRSLDSIADSNSNLRSYVIDALQLVVSRTRTSSAPDGLCAAAVSALTDLGFWGPASTDLLTNLSESSLAQVRDEAFRAIGAIAAASETPLPSGVCARLLDGALGGSVAAAKALGATEDLFKFLLGVIRRAMPQGGGSASHAVDAVAMSAPLWLQSAINHPVAMRTHTALEPSVRLLLSEDEIVAAVRAVATVGPATALRFGLLNDAAKTLRSAAEEEQPALIRVVAVRALAAFGLKSDDVIGVLARIAGGDLSFALRQEAVGKNEGEGFLCAQMLALGRLGYLHDDVLRGIKDVLSSKAVSATTREELLGLLLSRASNPTALSALCLFKGDAMFTATQREAVSRATQGVEISNDDQALAMAALLTTPATMPHALTALWKFFIARAHSGGGISEGVVDAVRKVVVGKGGKDLRHAEHPAAFLIKDLFWMDLL